MTHGDAQERNPEAAATPKRRSPWVWVLAFLVVSGIGFGALIWIGCAIGANACPFGESRSETSTDGAVIFGNNCAVCHGVDANGTDAGPTLIAGSAAELDLDELEYKIGRGRPFAGMPRFKTELTSEQINAVARYLLGLREPEPEPEGTP